MTFNVLEKWACLIEWMSQRTIMPYLTYVAKGTEEFQKPCFMWVGLHKKFQPACYILTIKGRELLKRYPIDQNILPCIGVAILEKSATPQEKCPVGGLLSAAPKAQKYPGSSRALELFQAYSLSLFGFRRKITCYRC